MQFDIAADLSYGELCILLQSHFQPKPNTILQRYNFHSTYKKTDQLIGDFVAELNLFFILPKQRLVCGVADLAMQRRLLGNLILI